MKKFLLALFAILILVIIYLNRSSTDDLSSTPLQIADIEQTTEPVRTENKPQTKKQKPEVAKRSCDRTLQKKLQLKSNKLWRELRQKLDNENFNDDLIQIAAIQTPPHQGSLKSIKKPINQQFSPDYNKKVSARFKLANELITTAWTNGFEAVLNKIEHKNISLQKLNFSPNSPSSRSFLGEIYDMSPLFKNVNVKALPTISQIEKLVSLGYQITEKDYLSLTTSDIADNKLEAIISLGPTPESLNRQYDQIPIDIAAKRGNRRLVNFWMQKHFIFPSTIKRQSFADLLLLNSIDTQEFLQNWSMLMQNNINIQDPETAKKLLIRKYLTLPDNIMNRLKTKAQQPYPYFNLTASEKSDLAIIKKEIDKLNQQVDIIFHPVKNCLLLDEKSKKDLNAKDAIIKNLLDQGKSKQDIYKKLSEIDPFLVDKFKKEILNGKYYPFIKPDISTLVHQLSPNFSILVFALLDNNIDKINELISTENLTNLDNILIVSSADKTIPDDIINKSKAKITALPPLSYAQTKWLSPEFLEAHNIDPLSLNKIDQFDKNLFYYATKNNQVELMRWLAEHESNLVSDKYGSDPMDMALKWNTHSETLKTLCDLNFPLKPKHRDKFLEIQQNDPQEAEEILQNCPVFSEQ